MLGWPNNILKTVKYGNYPRNADFDDQPIEYEHIFSQNNQYIV